MKSTYKSHVVRIVLGLVVFAVIGGVGKYLLTPKSFGKYGHYRADAIEEEAQRGIRHWTNASCLVCHQHEAGIHLKGLHKTISCEFCHSAYGDHIKDGQKIASMPVRKDQEIRVLCLRCHNRAIQARQPLDQVGVVANHTFRLAEDAINLRHAVRTANHATIHAPDFDHGDLYLHRLGIEAEQHDIRFVEDDWESPTLGAAGLGWEVWLDGMEVSQFTYFQQVGGVRCKPVSVELTYGLLRIAMFLQGCDHVKDLRWGGGLSWGEVQGQFEKEYSAFNFEHADIELYRRHFEEKEQEAAAKQQAAEAEADLQPADGGGMWMREALRQTPSWLVSMVFHMILLLVLALWALPEEVKDNFKEIVLGKPEIVEEEEEQDESGEPAAG